MQGNVTDIAIAMVLGAVSAALCGYLLVLLFGPLLATAVGSRQTLRLKRATTRLANADKFIDSRQYQQAVAELKKSVLLDPSFPAELLPAVRDHNQNLLSRCVTIAEEMNARPATLPVVERLFQQRIELLGLQTKAADAYGKLRSRRINAGKEIPNWSQTDFSSRLKEIGQELEKNTADLDASLRRLFAEIVAPVNDSVTIH